MAEQLRPPRSPYQPPPYPYDRLNTFKAFGDAFEGGLINLSIGSPADAALPAISEAFLPEGSEVGYPSSLGSLQYRGAASSWLHRRFGVDLPAGHLAACIGTKEFVASLPGLLHLRDPSRDTILYPAVSYPSYAMGAEIHGLRSVPVPVDDQWRLNLDAVDRRELNRALCIWVNSPGNPAGGLDDLEAAARWGRAHGIPVISDECYIEFTWASPYGPRSGGNAIDGRSILEHGTEGVLAVHSLSKRSNFAGARAGFYAGDGRLVRFLSEMRKHTGMMLPGPVQKAAIVAFQDDDHVDVQRQLYRERLEITAGALRSMGLEVDLPGGGFYLWVAAPDGDAWGLAETLARRAGILVSPGEFYGPAGAGYIRVAVVASNDRLRRIETRLDGFRL